jgi:phosphoglycerate dehydrogenase-like enzyme
MLKVFVTGTEVNAERLTELRAAAPAAVVDYFPGQSELAAAAAEADVVAGFVPRDVLARAKNLKWVHSWAAGPDSQLYPEFVAHPVTLTCSKGNGAIPLAEHAIMLMLMLNRNATRWIDNQREHRWEHFVHGELNGLTCGIIGAGHSGEDLALKAKAFHMQVIGLRRSQRAARNFDRMYRREELHEFLAASDFVVVTAPKTPETQGMLGDAEFRAMKKSAFYVCFSRGGIADDAALLRALSEGTIAGAGLDAHGVEPLLADSPFWTAPNTIITPHNGAGTLATRRRGYEIFRDNLRRYAAGEPLFNVVDKAAGY